MKMGAAMKFTYNSGQRPLDGYTIKRGVGRGGFGEVYYAVSDGGKEVALKLVRGNQEVELRGMAQCLNLKHPHLVSLYDMKTDAQGDHWVVMEYIAGEPLSPNCGSPMSQLRCSGWGGTHILMCSCHWAIESGIRAFSSSSVAP